jgi:hypothetical protein
MYAFQRICGSQVLVAWPADKICLLNNSSVPWLQVSSAYLSILSFHSFRCLLPYAFFYFYSTLLFTSIFYFQFVYIFISVFQNIRTSFAHHVSSHSFINLLSVNDNNNNNNIPCTPSILTCLFWTTFHLNEDCPGGSHLFIKYKHYLQTFYVIKVLTNLLYIN